jgi:NifU-like protein involved in Fe-S cluster formation
MSGSKLYSDRLLSYWDPSLFGFKHESYTHGASEVSQLCGDEVEYRLIINNNVLEIVDVWARGCCVSECCAAMLAELARGKTVDWGTNPQTMMNWPNHVNVPLGESRKQSCMMLAIKCLRKTVDTPLTSTRRR